VQRPVRVVLTRREDFLMSNPGPESEIWLRTGARRDGTLVALQATITFDAGAEAGAPASIAAMLLGGYYRTPHLLIEAMEVLTNKPPNGAYRAPGAPQATFAIESQMDLMARQLGMDPVEFRLRNCSQPGDPMPNGRPWATMGLRQVLEALRDHPKYRRRERGEGIGYGPAAWNRRRLASGPTPTAPSRSCWAWWTSPAPPRRWPSSPPRRWACRRTRWRW
jgi:CO/xanthine dehydrogenase Mo-binding subunit